LLKQPSAKLSVNILQRLAIGRSAIVEPAIFLLDEPLSNVDAAFRAVMRTELKHLQRQFKQTMVYVTHDQLEAMTMADRIAVMDHGVLQQVGTPLEVYNNPVNLFVADFIGSPGMNRLKGRLADSDLGLVVDLGPLGASQPLDLALAAAARENGVREVVYGFRPERVTLAATGQGLALPVTFVERIGARTVVHLGDGEQRVKTVFDNDVGLQAGETAHISVDAGSVRLFDAASGMAIREA
ncbi:MAG: ABC transporter ATP-binding protein, partial [Rhizobiaceae bacterium]|nr:ABC transporter ATP-binding protein [Rhizobiaceae bacterium]